MFALPLVYRFGQKVPGLWKLATEILGNLQRLGTVHAIQTGCPVLFSRFHAPLE